MWIFSKRIKVPEDIKLSQKKILHISDTPESVYKFLQRLLKEVQPDIIIHTGDLVDNIKLERKPWLEGAYRRKLEVLKRILSKTDQLYIIPGNEDKEEIIREIFQNSAIIVRSGTVLNIWGKSIGVGHEPEDVSDLKADFLLYGHDPKEKFGLNGVHSVNIITYPDWKVFKLPYPSGTAFDRGYRFPRGL
ncbi:metallophosphoesterase [Pyrococcus kukulkanii]|uniref:metallophosphoesterase n=1 Tax=Pyrococcus kukulkanii TaxID=1609559 RepID=UPI000F24898A|nr:MAG: metallophosphoesterase [Thermococci archaeon]